MRWYWNISDIDNIVAWYVSIMLGMICILLQHHIVIYSILCYNHVYFGLIKSKTVSYKTFLYKLDIYLGKMTYITNRRRPFSLPGAERNSNIKRNPNNRNVKRFSCTRERLWIVWNMGTSKKGFDSWIPRNRRGNSGRRGHVDVFDLICTFKLCVYF